jgi:hypothetical protein
MKRIILATFLDDKNKEPSNRITTGLLAVITALGVAHFL